MTRRLAPVLAGVVLLASAPVRAWGPHTEITRAALDVLPAEDRAEARLGRVALQRYSWLPDYRDASLPDYAPNDYLLFRESPRHVSHLLPDVRATYRPFFLRTLQALRTESRENAARWTGALLHFLQDSGSPPHALPTEGPVHFRMENWLDAERIEVPGHRPKRLGRTPEAALAALERRMEEEVRAARALGERLKPLCEAGDEAAARPLVLEAALRSARLTADVLHTLLRLVPENAERGTGELEVLVRAPRLADRPLAPVRLEVEGTPYFTFSEAVTEATADYYRGRLLLRNLAPGRVTLRLTRRPGEELRIELELPAGRTRRTVEIAGPQR